jgi:hypothetical protein
MAEQISTRNFKKAPHKPLQRNRTPVKAFFDRFFKRG